MGRIALLGMIMIVGCSSPDSQVFKLSPGGKASALATFTSAPGDSVKINLLLKDDSTFLLDIMGSSAATQRIEGPLRIDSTQYQLFFSDSVDNINELIAPVHQDASVVVYPDRSIALDRALSQFYVRDILVSRDSSSTSE